MSNQKYNAGGEVVGLVELTGSNVQENPFQSKEGQSVVSVQESFLSRLFREGRPLNMFATGGTSSTPNVLTPATPSITASPGCEFYPISVSVSCDVDAQLFIKIDTKIADVGASGVIWEMVYAKAGTPFVRRYDGDIKVLEGGQVQISVNSITAGKIFGSIYGLEVVSNA